jgi:hypothetical protein
LKLLDDNPTTDDALGFGESVDALVQVVAGARRPLTIGVFGGWGSGKTSLMKMVQARLQLEAKTNVKTVWFNAWKYDGKEAIWNALIQTIFLAMKEDLSTVEESRREAFRQRLLHVSKELAKYAAKVGTRFVPGNILREDDIDAVLAALSSGADDRLFEFVNSFEAEFDRLVTEYVGPDGYLVIFIDDLDRCLPENAIQVLEALKLYLDRANCVFVVGVEPAVVEEAIRRRYNDNPELSPTEYLEKIVQVPFVLPRIRTNMALALAAPVIGRAALSKRQRASLDTLVRVGLERNPRRIKRFINAFMIATLSETELDPEEQLVLAKILVLRAAFPDFYRRLTHEPSIVAQLWISEGNPLEQTTLKRRIGPREHWEARGIGECYDRDLRRLLEETAEIPIGPKQIRPWIRMAGGDAGAAEQGDEN